MKLNLLALMTVSLLAACGGDTDTSTPQTPVRQTEPKAETAPVKEVVKPAEVTTEIVDPVLKRGKRMFLRCKSCHTVDEGGRNGTGPNLYKIFNAEAAQKEGFKYSKAMQASAVVWDDAAMDLWIEKPRELVPGTSMAFVGLKKPEDREALIKYLKSVTE